MARCGLQWLTQKEPEGRDAQRTALLVAAVYFGSEEEAWSEELIGRADQRVPLAAKVDEPDAKRAEHLAERLRRREVHLIHLPPQKSVCLSSSVRVGWW